MYPLHKTCKLGFDVDLAKGVFTIQVEHWDALHLKMKSTLLARLERVLTRSIASFVGTIILCAWHEAP